MHTCLCGNPFVLDGFYTHFEAESFHTLFASICSLALPDGGAPPPRPLQRQPARKGEACKVHRAASAGDDPIGWEVPKVLHFPWEKSTQTRNKGTEEGRQSLSLIPGIFYPSFIAAILINKYDACSILSTKYRRSGRAHARVQSGLHRARQTQFFGTQAFKV